MILFIGTQTFSDPPNLTLEDVRVEHFLRGQGLADPSIDVNAQTDHV